MGQRRKLAKKKDIAAVELIRLAMTLGHSIGDLANEIEDEQRRLNRPPSV